MNCQQISKYIYQYCEGKVSPELNETIKNHLQKCKNCSSNYQLTMIENEVLTDKSDIPTLNSHFSIKIMAKIIPDFLSPVETVDAKNTFWQSLIKIPQKNKYYLAASIVLALTLVSAYDFMKNNMNPLAPQNYNLSDMTSSLNPSVSDFKQLGPTTPENTSGEAKTDNNEVPVDNESNTSKQTNNTTHNDSGTAVTLKAQTAMIANGSAISDVQPSLYTTPATIREGSYPEAASRHYEDKSKAPAPSGPPKMNLIPENVPPEYKLMKVSILEKQNKFIYQNINNQENLYIQIVYQPEPMPQAKLSQKSASAAPAAEDTYNYSLKAEVQDEEAANSSADSAANNLTDPQIIITSDLDNNPQVIISGNIAPEELARLARIIKIVEEK